MNKTLVSCLMLIGGIAGCGPSAKETALSSQVTTLQNNLSAMTTELVNLKTLNGELQARLKYATEQNPAKRFAMPLNDAKVYLEQIVPCKFKNTTSPSDGSRVQAGHEDLGLILEMEQDVSGMVTHGMVLVLMTDEAAKRSTKVSKVLENYCKMLDASVPPEEFKNFIATVIAHRNPYVGLTRTWTKLKVLGQRVEQHGIPTLLIAFDPVY